MIFSAVFKEADSMQTKKKKKKKSKRSFIKRYYLFTALIVSVSFVFFSVLILILVTNHWWNEKMAMLGENSSTIAQSYIDAVTSDDENSRFNTLILGNNISTISSATESEYLVCDRNGKIILCPEFLSNGGKVCEKHSAIEIDPSLTARAKGGKFTSFTSISPGFGNSFIVGMPIEYNNLIIGEVFAVEDAVKGLVPYVASIFKITIIAMFAAILLSFAAIYINTRRTTKPISEMIEAMGRYAKGDFSQHVNIDSSTSDMEEMGFALNKMVDELAVDNEAKKSFVANVSHELKTPMTTISGFVDGILDGTIPPEKEKEYLSTVSSEVKRLSRLVVSMLNLSKIESGEVKIQPVKYNLSSQILEILIAMEQRISEKNISIEGLDEIADVKVFADRDLLHQAVYNLLDNAVKFTDENGTISVFASKSDAYVTVTMRNTGAGLSKEDISRIFERFYKVDKSRSFDVKGVGLGLYIVKTIINMHGGMIYADSKEGEYTEFTFTVPGE